jgi:hypothetical protein
MNQEMLKYLEFLKNGGRNFVTEQFEYSPETINELYKLTIDILFQLEKIRSNYPLTKNMILKQHDFLLDKNNSGIEMYLVLYWILTITELDDSFNYAYNCIVEILNKYGLIRYDLKYISDYDLMNLLEKEKEQIKDDSHSKQLQKSIDASKKRLKSPVKPFPDFLVPEKHNKLANICKRVFGSSKSPKVYAIMFCLLLEKKFIAILNFKKVDFFEAWYNFNGDDIPKNRNFQGVYKYLDNQSVEGVVFKDANDKNHTDYLRIKNTFDSELKKNKLIE